MGTQIVVIETDPTLQAVEWAREHGAVIVIGDATDPETLSKARVHLASDVFVVTGIDEVNLETVIEVRNIVLDEETNPRGSLLPRFFAGCFKLVGLKRWNPKMIERFRAWRLPKLLFPTFPKLRCHTHILDRDLAGIVQKKTSYLERQELDSHLIDIHVFNAIDRTTSILLNDIARVCMEDHSPEKEQNDVLHYFLFGFGEFGQTLALRLAEFSHFESCRRIRLTIVEEDIEKKGLAFVRRHSTFCADFSDIQQRPWEFNPASDTWESKIERPSPDPKATDVPGKGIEYVCNGRFIEYTDIADDQLIEQMIETTQQYETTKPVVLVAFDNDQENFARAERLREKLLTKSTKWPIFVWIPTQRELSELLKQKSSDDFNDQNGTGVFDLIPFGQCYGSASYEEITDSWMDWLASHIHLYWHTTEDQEIKDYQAALKDGHSVKKMKRLNWTHIQEVAQSNWESCMEWERASSRSSAAHAVLKAATMRLKIKGYRKEPGKGHPLVARESVKKRLMKMEHNRWVAERLLTGWTYDQDNDREQKHRWQITPWDDLKNPPAAIVQKATEEGREPDDEQAKDAAIIHLLLSMINIGLLEVEPL